MGKYGLNCLTGGLNFKDRISYSLFTIIVGIISIHIYYTNYQDMQIIETHINWIIKCMLTINGSQFKNETIRNEMI